MKTFGSIFLIFFLFAGVSPASDETNKFRYDTKKAVGVGTVLHYVKTNIDGTQPENVSQYIAGAATLESFKFHEKGSRAGLVIAEMDWDFFSARSLQSWQVFAGGERRLFGTISFDGRTRRAEVFLPPVKAEKETLELKHFPVHLYNFDFASLNFAFPHLRDPKKSFVIGVADPTFSAAGPLLEYKGEVTVSYLGDEKRSGKPARKYRIDGPGLKNRGGLIWVNKKHGWIEDMEIDLPDNPDWTSFKLKLVRVEKMSRSDWENFIKARF